MINSNLLKTTFGFSILLGGQYLSYVHITNQINSQNKSACNTIYKEYKECIEKHKTYEKCDDEFKKIILFLDIPK
jgi:hypothetical protein